MKVLKPITYVEDDMLVSTTATESVTAWSSGTSYSIDDEALFDDYIWLALKAGSNKQPDLHDTRAQDAVADQYWLRKQPDNQSAMFANRVSTATEGSSPLEVVVDTGELINSVFLKSLDCNTIQVVAEDTATSTEIYDSGEVDITETLITNWYEYFFEPRALAPSVLLEGIPPFVNTRLTITLTGTGTVSCGVVAMGTLYNIGDAELGSEVGIIDFSSKEADEFGNVAFVERSFASTLDTRLWIDRGRFQQVRRLLSDLRATPCVWLLSDDDPGSDVFGWLRDFSLIIDYPTQVLCDLEIEGLL